MRTPKNFVCNRHTRNYIDVVIWNAHLMQFLNCICCGVNFIFIKESQQSCISHVVLHLFKFTNGWKVGFTHFAQGVCHLSLLHLPNRDERNEARGSQIEQEEEGEGSNRQENFNAWFVKSPRKGHAVDRKHDRNDKITLPIHAHVDQQTDESQQPRSLANFFIPQGESGNCEIKEQQLVEHPRHGTCFKPVQEDVSPFITAVPLDDVIVEKEVGIGKGNDQHQFAERIKMLGADEVVHMFHGVAHDEQHDRHRAHS